jgi:uncharacterized membrane protein YbhN (UPF0104 family)
MTRSGPAGRLRKGIGLLVIVLGFAYLFSSRVDWDEFVMTLAAFEWRFAPQIFLAQIAFILLGGLALWVLVAGRSAVSLGVLLTAYWRCVALGIWTPAGVGELSLAWLLRPYGLPLHDGLALMTIDKLVTVLAFGIFTVPILGWMLGSLADPALRPQALLLLLALTALIAAVLVALRIPRIRSFIRRILASGQAYLRSLRGFALGSPARLAGNLGLTLVRVTAGAAVLWWSIAAFEPDHSATFMQLLIFSSAARLLAFILPSPNGLGVYEVTLVELMSPDTVPAAGVLSGVLLTRIIVLLVIGLGLLLTGRLPEASETPHDS